MSNFAAWWSLLSKKACCGSKYQAQSCLFSFLAEILPNFFWQPKCKTLFLQPKPLLAVGTRELVAFILGSIFLAVKSVFGRILPKIKVGSQSAKNKSRTYCHSLCIGPTRQTQTTLTTTDSIVVEGTYYHTPTPTQHTTPHINTSHPTPLP